jgi:WD40 repeat protein
MPPSPTSPPVISVDTVAGLSNFLSFGQGEVLRSLAFSPDGTALATVAGNNEDFAVRLWEVGSGQPLRTLQGHTAIVWGVAFSPDGQMLASASSDGTAKVWDWHSGALLESLDFPSEVVSVTFSPDGQTLAVGGVDEWPDAAVWTWSVASWQPLMKLAEFWNIPALAYSPDGSLLVGGGTSRNVRVWKTSDGAELFVLYHSGQVSSVAISPDGSTVATGLCQSSGEAAQCTRGAVWLWNVHSGTLIKKLADFPDWVQGVAFSLDGSLLIAGSREGTLRAYATSDFQPMLVTSSPGGVMALAVSPDGRLLATGRANGEVDFWRVAP